MKRGRPPGSVKPFLHDPDRYAIALADMLRDFQQVSERKAFDLVTAVFFANIVEPSRNPRGLKQVEGWKLFGFEMRSKMTGVASRSSTLLKKAKRATLPEDENWRAAMSSAMAVTFLFGTMDLAERKALIRHSCNLIGEAEFAEACLIPTLNVGKFDPELFSKG